MTLFQRFLKNTDGNIGIMGAIATPVIVAASALAIDSNHLQNNSASFQSALDAATLAAAYADESQYNAIANDVFKNASGLNNIDNIQVNVTRKGEFIEGRATGNVDAFFYNILSPSTVKLASVSKVGFSENQQKSAATEEEAGTRACIVSLRDSDQGVILNSGARINALNCEVHVHAENTPVTYNSGVNVDITKFCIAGSSFGNNNGNLESDKYETDCDVAEDPYVGAYPEYDDEACDFNHFDPSELGKKNSRDNMQPGVYCGWSNFNSGGGTYNMDPGVYVIKDGGWNVNGGNDLVGEGITIYYEDNSVIQFNSGAGLDISAPASGDYANFIMVEKPNLNNPNRFILNGGNHMTMTGIIHLPNRDVTLNSGSRNTSTALVAQQIIVNSGARLNIEPSNYMPPVPGIIYNQVPVGSTQVTNFSVTPYIAQ